MRLTDNGPIPKLPRSSMPLIHSSPLKQKSESGAGPSNGAMVSSLKPGWNVDATTRLKARESHTVRYSESGVQLQGSYHYSSIKDEASESSLKNELRPKRVSIQGSVSASDLRAKRVSSNGSYSSPAVNRSEAEHDRELRSTPSMPNAPKSSWLIKDLTTNDEVSSLSI